MSLDYDICVIGAGISGLFVASKFSQINKKVAIIDASNRVGGQINFYREKAVHNIPLVKDVKAGDICDTLLQDCQKHQDACEFLLGTNIEKIAKNNNENNFEIVVSDKTGEKQVLCCKYIILSTGNGSNSPNKLQIAGAEQFENHTLLYEVDDKMLFKGKNVVISGGGDSAIDWAVELSTIADRIVVVHRREIVRQENPQFNTFQYLCDCRKVVEKIPYLITKLVGAGGKLSEIEILNTKTGVAESVACDYLLPFYGLKTTKNSILAKCEESVKIAEAEQGILVDYKNNETNEQNVFAIGDCCYYEGKIKNIPFGFFEGMRCFYEICLREDGTKNFYEKKH